MIKIKNFWQNIKQPLLILAPMDDVTDYVFREIICDVGKPSVLFTEFTNCDALFSAGREKQITRLKYSERQRPVVAQIWGSNPINYFKTAQLIKELGFDGIDINMGCPDRTVVKNKCGAALMKNHALTAEIVNAAREGAPNLPLSIKTRIGFNNIETETWLSFVLQCRLEALTVHLRTAKELSKTPAHWEESLKIIDLRNSLSPNTLIIGNGDVKSYQEAEIKIKNYGVDGVMIGRGVFNDLWIFNKESNNKEHNMNEMLIIMRKHVDMFKEVWRDSKNFNIMKKFFKVYINNFPGAAKLRENFMNCRNYEELNKLLISLF